MMEAVSRWWPWLLQGLPVLPPRQRPGTAEAWGCRAAAESRAELPPGLHLQQPPQPLPSR